LESLKKLKQWIVWRYEERPGEPKPAKVPYNPKVKHTKKENWQPVKNEKGFISPEYSGGAMSNKESTWGTYENAMKAFESDIFTGLGIMFANNLCGIDIDGCIENGMMIGPAKDIIDIMDSYTEYSPSGTGIHILFFGSIKTGKNFYKKNSTLGIEIYNTGRFFTFTGKTINNKRVEERSDQVEQVQLEYMKKETKRQPKNKSISKDINLSDKEILEIACKAKNGIKFSKLWNGDASEYKKPDGEDDHSSADFALCSLLAFYTQKDANRIDRLFRQSGLYRDKWEREDYRNNTIANVIASTTDTYNPNFNKSSAEEDFFGGEGGSSSGSGESEKLILGVSETPRGYVHTSIDNRSGDVITKILSNFKIDIKEMIVTDEETIVNAEVGNLIYKVNKTFNIKAFDNKSKFLEAVSDMNFFFKGKEDQLQDIKYIISKKDYKCLTGLNHLGFNKINDRLLFATNTKVIDCKSKIQNNDVVVPQEKIIMKSDILDIEGITKDELSEISPYLFNFNTLEITSSILGTLPTFFLKPLWFDCGVRTKHLFMWGESGSGKSETKRVIIIPFFSLKDNAALDCNNITQFSLNKYTESSNVFPVILEEYKPWNMKPQNIDIISGCLRNTYDMSNGIRGTKDQGINEYPQIATLVCIGEAIQVETATKERSMIVNFSKLESRTPEREKAYKELSRPKNKILLQKLGRSILNVICDLGIEKIMELRQTIADRNIASMPDNRVNDTVINAIIGISLFQMVFKQLGLDFEKEIGHKTIEITKAINRNCFNEILDGINKSKSIVDRTLELISTMKAHDYIFEDRHYKYVNGKSELALNVNLLFDFVTKYIKDYAVEGEFLTNKTQFCKQLMKTEYFITRKTVKFTETNSGFPMYEKKSNNVKAYVLDIEKITHSGLEIEDLLP
jgi:hypothetical protein